MEKILLSGGSGFLGKEIKKQLLNKNYCVLTLGRRNCDIKLDLTNNFKLPNSFKFEGVIHAAGKAHSVPKDKKEIDEFFKINYQGTINICNAIDQLNHKPKSFIFISSVAVYGVDTGILISESSPTNGITPYAKSKIMAENWLIEWAEKRNITLGILRLPLVAGKNPPGNLGLMVNGIKTGKYLSIGKANVNKSIVWSEDIASIIPKLFELGGIYNLTDGYHPTFSELEAVISKKLRKKSPKKIHIWVAKVLAKVGDIFGNIVPINSENLNKIVSPLTFDDSSARITLGWKSSNVLDKLEEIL